MEKLNVTSICFALYTGRWMLIRESIHTLQKTSRLFWEYFEKMWIWKDTEGYCSAYTVERSELYINISCSVYGPNTELSHTGSMEDGHQRPYRVFRGYASSISRQVLWTYLSLDHGHLDFHDFMSKMVKNITVQNYFSWDVKTKYDV